MKKKILALVLTVAMCTAMGATAFAASSSSSSSSSSSHHSSSSGSGSSSSSSSSTASEATKGNVDTDSVSVAVAASDGSVSSVSLTQYTAQVNDTLAAAAAAAVANGTDAGETVSAMLSAPASETLKAVINALGGNIALVNAGGYSVAAAAPADETGRVLASVGTVQGVTQYAFVILTGIGADGTVEIVEGVVDPVSLQVMGVFNTVPQTITVSVIVPAA